MLTLIRERKQIYKIRITNGITMDVEKIKGMMPQFCASKLEKP